MTKKPAVASVRISFWTATTLWGSWETSRQSNTSVVFFNLGDFIIFMKLYVKWSCHSWSCHKEDKAGNNSWLLNGVDFWPRFMKFQEIIFPTFDNPFPLSASTSHTTVIPPIIRKDWVKLCTTAASKALEQYLLLAHGTWPLTVLYESALQLSAPF